MKQLEWDGYFYDGESAKRHDVRVRITSEGLVIYHNNQELLWKYGKFQQGEEFYSAEKTHLESTQYKNQRLVVLDPDFTYNLKKYFPDWNRSLKVDFKTKDLRRVAFAASALILLFLPIFYLFILPLISSTVAKFIPVSFEEKLSEPYVSRFAPEENLCNGDKKFKDINKIFEKLISTAPNSAYKFSFSVVKSNVVNAFALPGGNVVVYSGLIEKTERSEQLAGVLAHEIQHVLNRHGMESLVKNYSLGLLISAVSGDTSGVKTTLNLAKFLGLMKYSRESEEEADVKGIKMMKEAKLDPNGMVEFFEIIKKSSFNISKSLEYVSTHPQTESRIETLKGYTKDIDYKPVVLFTDNEWKEIKKICDDSSIKDFSFWNIN